MGRSSIPPECLLRALLLQILFSVRSERQLMEELEYNLLFRWFVGLGMDDVVWVPTTFTKNRDRLLEGDVARAFFDAVPRKRVEEVFGWMKTVGLMRKTRHRERRKVGWIFTFTAAAYNLVRIRNLCAA